MSIYFEDLTAAQLAHLGQKINGYYPLYNLGANAQLVSSSGTAHTHELDGTTYYMPDGGIQGGGEYHGNYTGTAILDVKGANSFNSPASDRRESQMRDRSMGVTALRPDVFNYPPDFPLTAGITDVTKPMWQETVTGFRPDTAIQASGANSAALDDLVDLMLIPVEFQNILENQPFEGSKMSLNQTRWGFQDHFATAAGISDLYKAEHWTYGVPPGMTFDPTDGSVTGVPTTPGWYIASIGKWLMHTHGPKPYMNLYPITFGFYVGGASASQTISNATIEGGSAAYAAATASSIETITDGADDTATKVTGVLAVLVADTTWAGNTAGYLTKTASQKKALYDVAKSSLKILTDIRDGSGAAVEIPVADLKVLRPDLPDTFAPTTVKVAESGSSITVDADAGGGFTAPLEDGESTTVVMSGGGQAATLVISMTGGLYSIKDTDVGNDDLLEDDGSGGKQTVSGGAPFSALGDSFSYKGFNIYYGASGSGGGGSSGGDPFISTML